MITRSLSDAVLRASDLMRRHDWEQDNQMKSLASHMSPDVASQVLVHHANDITLSVRFFKWIIKQSTYCLDLDGRIRLLDSMLSLNLFGVLHKAVIVLLKDCSDSENELLKLMDVLDDMRMLGFRLNYPCYSFLLVCLAKLSMGIESLVVSRTMLGDGLLLGIIDYKSIINALCKIGFLETAEMFFARVLKLGFKLDVHLCTSLVLGSCRLGDLKEACRVFEIMSRESHCSPNSVTYSILIHGLCEAGKMEEASRLKEEMSKKGSQPTTRTYTVLIKALCDVGQKDKAFLLLDEMVKNGYQPNVHTYTVLIDMLCKSRKIDEAGGMFMKILKDGLRPTVVTFNALINGYCKEGRVLSAFELLSVMQKNNCTPNICTYNELLEGLCSINKPYKSMTLLRKMVDNSLPPNGVTYNILVRGFCREGELDMAFKIFSSMSLVGLEGDEITYTTLIDGLCKKRKLEQASGLLGLMVKKGIRPDEVTYAALVDGYCKTNRERDAFMLLEKMFPISKSSSPHLFNSFLNVFSKDARVNEEYALIGKMLRHGVIPSVVTYSILIDCLARAKKITCFFDILELMKRSNCTPNVYTYTIMINGLYQNGRAKVAETLLFKMLGIGVSPNDITYHVLVKNNVRVGRLDCAFSLIGIMVRNGCQPNHQTYLVLLAGLIILDRAIGMEAVSSISDTDVKSLIVGENVDNFPNVVFETMDVRHAVKLCKRIEDYGASVENFLNFVIMGLLKVKRFSEAECLMDDMLRHGFFPDKAVCSCIIEHLCKVEKLEYCLNRIKLFLSNGVLPSFASCFSLIYGLQSQGKVQEVKWVVSNLLGHIEIEDETEVSSYIEFLMGKDEPEKHPTFLQLIDMFHKKEKPII